ncbi:hypothetical protein B0H14DRAFT_3590424 [Mycena olivaceomarginata]|nr:hypothetical protein B0H14DRAFT_3590424 [Mycena olivaceomarginata]
MALAGKVAEKDVGMWLGLARARRRGVVGIHTPLPAAPSSMLVEAFPACGRLGVSRHALRDRSIRGVAFAGFRARTKSSTTPHRIFDIADEPPTWPGADDDDMDLQSISDPEDVEEEIGMDDSDVSTPRTPRSVSQPRRSSLTRTQNTIPIPPPTPLRQAVAPRAVRKSTPRRILFPASCPSPARGSTSGAVCLRPRILEGHGHGRGGRDRGRLGRACHAAWERRGDACYTHRPAHADARKGYAAEQYPLLRTPGARGAAYDLKLGLDGEETLTLWRWGSKRWREHGDVAGESIAVPPPAATASWRRIGCRKCMSSSRRWGWACCSAC